MKTFVVLMLCVLLYQNTYSQKRKEMKAKKVKSITVWVYDGKNDSEPRKESLQEFDKEGRTITEIDFNKEGKIKKKETTLYDNFGNKIKETYYNAKDNIAFSFEYTYNSKNDMTEKSEYINDVLQTKTYYKYNANGDKILESVFDKEEKLIKRISFTYNPKKLRETRQVIDVNGHTNSFKKYYYEYY